MANGDRRFTRIPPESTGDRLFLEHIWDLPYKNLVGSISVGDQIFCATSGVAGYVLKVITTGVTSGIASINLTEAAEDLINIDNEDIQIDGYTVATTDGVGYSIYTNANALVSGDNPYNYQTVDVYGAGQVRFRGGNPVVGVTNELRVASKTLLGEYTPVYNKPVSLVTDTAGSGIVTYESSGNRMHLQTTSSAGDEALLSSSKYHVPVYGSSHVFDIAIATGDVGKPNLIRRWGCFDGYEGLFFELNGTDLYLVRRSSVSGNLVEDRIARADWNGDQLDGSRDKVRNRSGYTLNLTNLNSYSLAYDVYSGHVQFGIYVNGDLIVLHHIYGGRYTNPNLPILRTGRLPIRATQENIGIVGSNSSMYYNSGRVFSDGAVDEESLGIVKTFSSSSDITLDADGYFTYALGFRLKDAIGGIPNRGTVVPKEVQVSFKDNTGNDVPVEVGFFAYTTLSGESWQTPSFSTIFEVDEQGTPLSNGVGTGFNFAQGTAIVPLSSSLSSRANFVNPIEITDSRIKYSIFIKNNFPSIYTNVTGRIAFKWIEVE